MAKTNAQVVVQQLIEAKHSITIIEHVIVFLHDFLPTDVRERKVKMETPGMGEVPPEAFEQIIEELQRGLLQSKTNLVENLEGTEVEAQGVHERKAKDAKGKGRSTAVGKANGGAPAKRGDVGARLTQSPATLAGVRGATGGRRAVLRSPIRKSK